MFKIFKKIIAREKYHPVLSYPWFVIKVFLVRRRYIKTLTRLRRKIAQGDRLKVIFLSMDTAKWKCQSIYDELSKSDIFDPYVALTMTEEDEHHSMDGVRQRNSASRIFYERHGCKVVDACEGQLGHVKSIEQLQADIVFYQVPWGNLPGQTVWDAAKVALTCYMPYGIDNVEWKNGKTRFDFHHMADFHLLLWQYYMWSDAMASYYRESLNRWELAGRIIGTGHSALDSYVQKSVANKLPGDFVIFAPHFSFAWNGHEPIMNLSTFHWSGALVLAYAKQHPEIGWAFKPHPKLRERLVEIGFMSEEDVDAYYAAWESLGIACYDGDYQALFLNSKAMITDCSSFLCEYMPVRKPLIRLIPDDIKVAAPPPCKRLYKSFYNCYSWHEAEETMDMILNEGVDPRRDERLAASMELNLAGTYAALNVVSAIRNELKV